MNVLLVEPDYIMASSARVALETIGHTVSVASAGQQAIDAMDTTTYDAILLEPQLGLHSGVEFLYELRSYSEWRDVPVVIWTMNRHFLHASYERALKHLGVRQVLYKPLTTLHKLTRVTNQLVST